MTRYAAERRAFLCESYVKCSSAGKCRQNFVVNFPGTQFQAQHISANSAINDVKHIWSLLDKKPANTCRVLTEEELDETGA
jgi:hypothetical protein